MGFFANLKERIFSLDIADNVEAKVKTHKENFTKNQSKITSSNLSKKDEARIRKEITKQGQIGKYVVGLSKTSLSFARAIKEIQARHNKVDEALLEEMEEALILADVSAPLAEKIIYAVRQEVKIGKITSPNEIAEVLADKLFTIYAGESFVSTQLNTQTGRINAFFIVGVNGVGKTTTIAKLANKFRLEGKKVIVAASDTFRAGAVEQLKVWCEKIGVDIVLPVKEGVDPASVVFDATTKALEGNYDILIVDTAGRLQNKVNLMNELNKMSKIVSRQIADAPHESLLVLDATTGQNALLQAIAFKEVTPLTGIVLTKMDGTSRGGIVFTIKSQLNLDVKLIGLGEGLDDLQEFDLDLFIYGLTKGVVD